VSDRSVPRTIAAGAEDRLVSEAVALATELIVHARQDRRPGERRQSRRLSRLVEEAAGREFTLTVTDQVLRSGNTPLAAHRLHRLVDRTGVPQFMGPGDRTALWLGAQLAPVVPRLVMPLVAARLRREISGAVIPAEDGPFGRHAFRRSRAGFRLNVNVLGEAVLGEDEAARRAAAVIAQLRRPDVDYVSVKMSAVFSQVSALAFDHTVETGADRLRPIFMEAAAHHPTKFINLDMEEYQDLRLTAAVFRRLLDEPELRTFDAGIALQAYLPDSSTVLGELCAWAVQRRSAGGGRIKIRIVKGANLAMEQVDAELHGWPQAPYLTKADVDANYKRMLDQVLDTPGDAVWAGVASHNLFDVAWALVLANDLGCPERIDIEMLEGMAPAAARAALVAAGHLILYAPIAGHDDLQSSIAYLVRRFDENTGPDNFLRQMFALERGSPAFDQQRRRFVAAVAGRDQVSATPRRTQNRSSERRRFSGEDPFANEPDTDFSLPGNQAWIHGCLERWRRAVADDLLAVVDGAEVAGSRWGQGVDPSRPAEPLYRYALADAAMVDRAVATAKAAAKRWATGPLAQRRQILASVATTMAVGRGQSIAAMVHDAGKTVAEADVEVSEAIDFARYYADGTHLFERLTDVGATPLGTVVVAPPWNFPYAIPAGGVLAALAVGNTVILKPAPESVLVAWTLARQCWEGGVPRDVLQFLPCTDDEIGRRLVTHADVDAVILTGSWDTARLFREWKPAIRLHGECSGKNAIVVTASADLDAAVRDIVRSAFGHAGQKCSAASLAIVEATVYDGPDFMRRLADATRSLAVGPASDLWTSVGPLIRPAEGVLARALTQLEPGEGWLVQPEPVGDNPQLWSPGVKVGVRAGSEFHQRECFGPVLGVMRAGSLEEAIRLQNDVLFGLTGGIHSLDEDEVATWLSQVEVGNAYVNRHITGAIVRRQAFGGWKRSVTGPGNKTGGPNHLLGLVRWAHRRDPTDDHPVDPALAEFAQGLAGGLDATSQESLWAAARSMARWWAEEFSVEHDDSRLRSEANILRYRPLPGLVVIRAEHDGGDLQLAWALIAARVAGVSVQVSSAVRRPFTTSSLVVEAADALVSRLAGLLPARLRLLGTPAAPVLEAAAGLGIEVDDTAAMANGRVELTRWLREQAVSATLHRYGNIMAPAIGIMAPAVGRASHPGPG
jgi:RHH-type proline utilization regulon transcriptional repressor/proline dehydrogenase/delta 1-pyrroline-5-carboxylate dehydrogenase